MSLKRPPGAAILDPFAGSGMTLLAAQLEGRQAVGIERERDYCRISIERLRGQSSGSGGAELATLAA